MTDDLRESWLPKAAGALFAVISALIAADLIADYREGASWGHLIVETGILLAATGGIVLLVALHLRTRTSLEKTRVEAEQWRRESRELIQGLAIVIENQFDRWVLSRAEAEVGMLLLKGLSHKEIARVRQTSERTAREQARALYRKSGLSGRPALSAFFLEDLLLPPEDNHSVR